MFKFSSDDGAVYADKSGGSESARNKDISAVGARNKLISDAVEQGSSGRALVSGRTVYSGRALLNVYRVFEGFLSL
jgi:hypothetical protein